MGLRPVDTSNLCAANHTRFFSPGTACSRSTGGTVLQAGWLFVVALKIPYWNGAFTMLSASTFSTTQSRWATMTSGHLGAGVIIIIMCTHYHTSRNSAITHLTTPAQGTPRSWCPPRNTCRTAWRRYCRNARWIRTAACCRNSKTCMACMNSVHSKTSHWYTQMAELWIKVLESLPLGPWQHTLA